MTVLAPPPPCSTGSRASPHDARRALAERRAHALRTMFPKLYSLRARRADLWRAIAIERYLAQATHAAELEMRIHEVQRQQHFGGTT